MYILMALWVVAILCWLVCIAGIVKTEFLDLRWVVAMNVFNVIQLGILIAMMISYFLGG